MPTNSSVAMFTTRKLRPFLALAAERGIELDPVLAPHATSIAEMCDPETRLPRLSCVAIMRDVFECLADPLAGLHAAARLVLEDLDLLGYLAQQHEHVLAALEAVVGYVSLIGDASRAALERASGSVTLTQWIAGDVSQLPELADYLIASSHSAICAAAGHSIPLLRVRLARPTPANPRAYRDFFGAPVEFGVLRGALVYPEAPLIAAKLRGDARLGQLLTQQAAARQLAADTNANLIEQSRFQLRAQLAEGAASCEALARSLGLGERTLRRRLGEAGTSYRDLLDDVRRDRALPLAAAGELSVGELATQLGFSDAGAFTRAFRRWTGTVPSRYRRGSNNAALHTPSSEANKPPSSAG